MLFEWGPIFFMAYVFMVDLAVVILFLRYKPIVLVLFVVRADFLDFFSIDFFSC